MRLRSPSAAVYRGRGRQANQPAGFPDDEEARMPIGVPPVVAMVSKRRRLPSVTQPTANRCRLSQKAEPRYRARGRIGIGERR